MIEYESPFSLLEDTYQEISDAVRVSERMRASHNNSAMGFWPSLASIVLTEPDDNGKIVSRVEGTCMRRGYYHATKEEPTDPMGKRGFDVTEVGSAIEDIFVRRFRNLSNYKVVFPTIRGDKLKFADLIGVRGEVDLILQHRDTGIMFGVEMKTYDGPWAAMEVAGYSKAKDCYKSTMPYIRKYLDKGRKMPNPQLMQEPMPKLDNLLQTMLYLDEFWNDGIKLWKLIYVARDKGPEAEHDISLYKEDPTGTTTVMVNGIVRPHITIEAIHDRFRQLKDHVTEGKLPPRDYVVEYDPDEIIDNEAYPKWMQEKVKHGETHRDWRCDFCPFLGKCIEDSGNAPF